MPDDKSRFCPVIARSERAVLVTMYERSGGSEDEAR